MTKGPLSLGSGHVFLTSDCGWLFGAIFIASGSMRGRIQPEESLIVNNVGIRKQGKGFLQGSKPGLLPPGLFALDFISGYKLKRIISTHGPESKRSQDPWKG